MSNVNVYIADQEDVSKTLIEMYLKDIEFISNINKFSSLEEVMNNINPEAYNIIIVDVSEKSKDILEKISKLANENKNYKFLLISYNLNTNFIVDILRSGAQEFLNKPLIKGELLSAINKLYDQFINPKTVDNRGKIISVFSNKGGLGKTTVAVNLAKELADITKEKVILVDLNMHLGDVTAFLDVTPKYDMKYVVDNIDQAENKEEFLLGIIDQYKFSNLYILADSAYRETIYDITSSDIHKLLDALRKTFKYIVIDNSSVIDNKFKKVSDEADLILLITTANLPTLRNCQRSLNLFDKFGYDADKLKIVINRYISNEDYTIEDVETVLNKKIYWKIPNNYFTIIESINKGLTLQELSPNSNVAQNYNKLAQDIISRV